MQLHVFFSISHLRANLKKTKSFWLYIKKQLVGIIIWCVVKRCDKAGRNSSLQLWSTRWWLCVTLPDSVEPLEMRVALWGTNTAQIQDSGQHKGMKTAPRKLLTSTCCDVNSRECPSKCVFGRRAAWQLPHKVAGNVSGRGEAAERTAGSNYRCFFVQLSGCFFFASRGPAVKHGPSPLKVIFPPAWSVRPGCLRRQRLFSRFHCCVRVAVGEGKPTAMPVLCQLALAG